MLLESVKKKRLQIYCNYFEKLLKKVNRNILITVLKCGDLIDMNDE